MLARQALYHLSNSASPSFFSFILDSGSRYVAQDALELEIFLPQSPECWDYRHAPSRLALGCFSISL
jgi:hypothetical protein